MHLKNLLPFSTDSECSIHESTLLSYARQIAIGMVSAKFVLFTLNIIKVYYYLNKVSLDSTLGFITLIKEIWLEHI